MSSSLCDWGWNGWKSTRLWIASLGWWCTSSNYVGDIAVVRRRAGTEPLLRALAGLMAVSLIAACSPRAKIGARDGASWAVENVLRANCLDQGCIVNVLAFPVALPVAATVGMMNKELQYRESKRRSKRRWLEEVGSPPKTLRGDPDAPDYLPCPSCQTTTEPP